MPFEHFQPKFKTLCPGWIPLSAQSIQLSGELRFGASPSLTIASHVVPPILAEFSRIHPAVQIELRVDNSEVVLESVSESMETVLADGSLILLLPRADSKAALSADYIA
jgi:DNA-binding transcriptional LysR family regulator